MTRLRLHRDEPTTPTADLAGDLPRTYPFPSNHAARRRLVAGTVDVPATPEGPAASANSDPDVIGRVTPTTRVVQDIERTLDRMQTRLDRLKRDADRGYRFPDLSGDDGPRAA